MLKSRIGKEKLYFFIKEIFSLIIIIKIEFKIKFENLSGSRVLR